MILLLAGPQTHHLGSSPLSAAFEPIASGLACPRDVAARQQEKRITRFMKTSKTTALGAVVTERPRVLLSFAQSLDGRIATITGDSRWISGDETLTLAHELRRDNESILVGIGTVLRDDPLLSCRLADARSPVRIILDSSLRLPLDSQIVQTARSERTLVFCTRNADPARREALERAGVEVHPGDTEAPGMDLRKMLRIVGGLGISSVFVEGGSAVITSFLAARLVDRMVVVIAPLIIGRGTDSVGELHTRAMADALRLRPISVRNLGQDLVWEMEL